MLKITICDDVYSGEKEFLKYCTLIKEGYQAVIHIISYTYKTNMTSVTDKFYCPFAQDC